MKTWLASTRHCYPSNWRVCACCGVSPPNPMTSNLRKQGGHSAEEVPPYAAELQHLRSYCYALKKDGSRDETTWNMCQ